MNVLSSKADLPGKLLAKDEPVRKKTGSWEASSSSSSTSLALLSGLSKREHLRNGLSLLDLIFPQCDIQNLKMKNQNQK